MTENQQKPAEELLVNYLTGMVSDSERNQALEWIHANSDNEKYFAELRTIYEMSKLAQPEDKFDVETSLVKVKARHYRNIAMQLAESKQQHIRNYRIRLVKYAAACLLIVGMGIIGYRYTRNRPDLNTQPIWNTMEAPFGSRARLTLADGTKVWLNAGSQLRYASDFGRNNRKVYLNGEAYFDVTRDDLKQFIVVTPHIDVKVFGTQFNVKAYNEENIVQTTLVEGSVTIERKGLLSGKKAATVLKPNETAVYYVSGRKEEHRDSPQNRTLEKREPENKIQVLPNINPRIYTSWKDDKWLINAEPLSSLAIKLERRYNVKITINTKELQEYRFSGTLKDETLEQVLNLIKLTAPIEYTVENNQVTLTEYKNFKETYDELLIKNN